jgi:hypothetical protein
MELLNLDCLNWWKSSDLDFSSTIGLIDSFSNDSNLMPHWILGKNRNSNWSIQKIQWITHLHSSGKPLGISDRTIEDIIVNNRDAMLDWCKNSRIDFTFLNVVDRISSSVNAYALQRWMDSGIQLKYTRLRAALENAAQNGHLEALKWWKRSGLPIEWSQRTLQYIVWKGHTYLIDWWKQNGLPLK